MAALSDDRSEIIKDKQSEVSPEITAQPWTAEMEVALFHAIHEHRPIGVNRHFEMLLIHEKLNGSSKRKLRTIDIWDHLRTMYDLRALNDSETLPFPNTETEFYLPCDQYDDLKDQSYPRNTIPPAPVESGDKEGSGGVEGEGKHGGSSRASKSSSGADLSDKESSKDGRKRTRLSISTPVASSPAAAASSVENTPTNKRSRRI